MKKISLFSFVQVLTLVPAFAFAAPPTAKPTLKNKESQVNLRVQTGVYEYQGIKNPYFLISDSKSQKRFFTTIFKLKPGKKCKIYVMDLKKERLARIEDGFNDQCKPPKKQSDVVVVDGFAFIPGNKVVSGGVLLESQKVITLDQRRCLREQVLNVIEANTGDVKDFEVLFSDNSAKKVKDELSSEVDLEKSPIKGPFAHHIINIGIDSFGKCRNVSRADVELKIKQAAEEPKKEESKKEEPKKEEPKKEEPKIEEPKKEEPKKEEPTKE